MVEGGARDPKRRMSKSKAKRVVIGQEVKSYEVILFHPPPSSLCESITGIFQDHGLRVIRQRNPYIFS